MQDAPPPSPPAESPPPPSGWARVLRIAGALFLGLVFLLAARLKSVDMAEARLPIAFSLGAGRETANAILYVLLTYEVLLGILLISGWKRRQVVGAALVTLFAYTLFLLYLASDPEAPGCNCFGVKDTVASAQRSNLFGAARNIVLMAVAATVFLLQREADQFKALHETPPGDGSPPSD